MRNGETRDGRNARLKDEGRLDEFNERVEVLNRGATTKNCSFLETTRAQRRRRSVLGRAIALTIAPGGTRCVKNPPPPLG